MEDALEIRLAFQEMLRRLRKDPDVVVVRLSYETKSTKESNDARI